MSIEITLHLIQLHCWCVEGLKHNLGHLFSVGFGVEGTEPLSAELGVPLVPHAAHCRKFDAKSEIKQN